MWLCLPFKVEIGLNICVIVHYNVLKKLVKSLQFTNSNTDGFSIMATERTTALCHMLTINDDFISETLLLESV